MSDEPAPEIPQAQHGISLIAGVQTREVTLGKTTLTFGRRKLKDYADIDAFIFSRRPNILAALAQLQADMDPGFRAELMRVVCEAAQRAQFVTPEEMTDYEITFTGHAHQVYLAGRDRSEGLTLEKALHYWESATHEQRTEVIAAMHWVREEAELKN